MAKHQILAPLAEKISTRLTTDDYARCVAAAGAQPLAEWARDALIAAATHASADAILLRQILSARATILTVLQEFANASGVTVDIAACVTTVEEMGGEELDRRTLALLAPTRTARP